MYYCLYFLICFGAITCVKAEFILAADLFLRKSEFEFRPFTVVQGKA